MLAAVSLQSDRIFFIQNAYLEEPAENLIYCFFYIKSYYWILSIQCGASRMHILTNSMELRTTREATNYVATW
jgi:hypothetical protein